MPAHFVCSALQPFGPSPFRKRLHPQFAIVDPHRTQSVLVALVAHWAYFGLFPPQAAASVRPTKNARNDVHPTIRNGRPAAPEGLQYSLVHWAYYGLFRAPRAAFVRPVISD